MHDEAYWSEFERFGRKLLEQQWIFAKTMAHNPHWYTLRKKWKVDAEFQWAVAFLRERGYRKKFGKTWYTQIDVNDFFYWTMGAPINYPNGMAYTILINRKPLTALEGRVVPYDSIADQYDTLFTDQESLHENATVFGMVGEVNGLNILDIGCGTGLALDYTMMSATYLGIDPSEKMLAHLKERHPDAETICSTLGSFVAPLGYVTRYDIVLALFGTGSYLTDEELARVPTLLVPGGIALVMFYAPGYFPETYKRTGVTVPHRPWQPGRFQPLGGLTTIQTVGGHVCCLYRKDTLVASMN